MTKSTSWYAKKYAGDFGLHLVPIEPKRKFPRDPNWGNKAISDPIVAEAFYTAKSDWNLGVAIGPSRLCSIDVDCMKSFLLICDAMGIDLDALIKDTPTIMGRPEGRRITFRVPEGVELPYVSLRWRPESDPDGSIHSELRKRATEARKNGNTELADQLAEEAKQYALYTVFELRSSCDGKQRQDVFPPSIHPDTGEPYVWVTQPRKDWPEPPKWLLAIWQEFDQFRPQLMAACPWSKVEEVYKSKQKPSHAPKYSGGGFARVVSEFNNANSIAYTLENYGYKRIGKRYLSPNSSTKLPGVVIFEQSNRAWIHHASDGLCSDESGQPVSPFDLRCYYDFGGDFKAAVTTIAAEIGIRTDAPKESTYIDQETGEVLASPTDPTAPSISTGSQKFVDFITPLPWLNSNNKPLSSIENLKEIINRLGVTVRYNVIKKEEEILIPNTWFSVDNQQNSALSWLISECSKFNYPITNVERFITPIADQNPYNPVTTWIQSKPWDGIGRLKDLFDTITTDGDNELKETLIKRWMLSAVAAAFSPSGVTARGVLVFQGEQQMGKTFWFKRLVPEHLDVTQDGVILRPDDKDSVKQACSNWLVELGELDATFKRSDIAQLKGFITRNVDVVRLPYARKESSFARRTVFFGSVNPREFLNDTTGNTRFWTISCTAIDNTHTLDMQQVWAEAYELWQAGEGHHLTQAETDLLNRSNEDYQSIDPIEERILKDRDWNSDRSSWVWKQATEVLLECGMINPTQSDARKAAAILRRLNNNTARRNAGKRELLVPRATNLSAIPW